MDAMTFTEAPRTAIVTLFLAVESERQIHRRLHEHLPSRIDVVLRRLFDCC